MSPGSPPAGLPLPSWGRPILTSMPRSACIPAWRLALPATCLPPSPPCRAGLPPMPHPAGYRWRDSSGSCRRSCSTATRIGRSIRATAIRSSPRHAAPRPCPAGHGHGPAGSGTRRAGLPPHAACRRPGADRARAVGRPWRRPCLVGRQPCRLLHRSTRARCHPRDAPLLPRAPPSHRRPGGALNGREPRGRRSDPPAFVRGNTCRAKQALVCRRLADSGGRQLFGPRQAWRRADRPQSHRPRQGRDQIPCRRRNRRPAAGRHSLGRQHP